MSTLSAPSGAQDARRSGDTRLTAELVARLHDGPVARDVGLGAQRVVGLAAAQRAGDAIHGEGRGLLVLQLLEQVFVDPGVKERNESAVLELGGLVAGGGAQLSRGARRWM